MTVIRDSRLLRYPQRLNFDSRIILDRLRDAVAQGLLPDDEVYRRAIANLEALDARVTRLRLAKQSKS